MNYYIMDIILYLLHIRGSNFFFDNNSLIVSDLDDCKKRPFQFILKKKLSKDKKRILKSFESYPRIKESLSRRF